MKSNSMKIANLHGANLSKNCAKSKNLRSLYAGLNRKGGQT
jgi:hypothetical protein